MAKPERESALLSHIYAHTKGMSIDFPQVVAGPGHDCAVVRVGPRRLLLKVDQVIEGRHFRSSTPLPLIAHKAMARAISDIAACGGTPLAAMAAAALPDRFTRASKLFDLLHASAAALNCPIVGGDISRTSGPLTLSISVIGLPHTKRGPVLRSGAKPGDLLYVTDHLGGSLERRTGRGRHLTFMPRLAEAKILCDTLGRDLHAMMDLSDGLGRDAGRMARMSEVSMLIDARALPMHRGVRSWKNAAGDGEDYELFFAAAPDAGVPLELVDTPVRCIGRVVHGDGKVWIEHDRRRTEVSELGWEH